jgi:hypothetical protein
MYKTIQNTYVPMRGATGVSAVDSTLTPDTAGYTLDEHDRPAGAFELGEDCNAACLIFYQGGDASDDTNSTANIWGYAKTGPAEWICDLTFTTGDAIVNDVTTSMWIDTATIDTQTHIKTVSVADSANERIAKVAFDVVGLKYIYVEVVELTTDTTLVPLIRTF